MGIVSWLPSHTSLVYSSVLIVSIATAYKDTGTVQYRRLH
jgi:hypothetical protein